VAPNPLYLSQVSPKTRFWLLELLEQDAVRPVLWWRGQPTSRAGLLERVTRWQELLIDRGVRPGESVAVVGDFTPDAIALLLALADHRCVAVPLTTSAAARQPELEGLACASAVISLQEGGGELQRREGGSHPLLERLRAAGEPGIVIFTSGSTAASKAALHSLDRLVDKTQPGRPYVALAFLLWDHIGGQNTLLRLLASGGELVLPEERTPDAICAAIERHRVELLPTSPTFLNLLLMSGALERADLSSLRLVTYGTEPMPQSTLRRLHQALPHARLKQTYGLSELGILKTRSEGSDSLWIEPPPDGEHKVVDGVLWLKVPTAMLGYLNAPSPFDEEGWYNTGDLVEVRGPYLRFLGRRSEVINVGGEKVHPAAVESVLLEMEGVLDATVRGASNPLTGQIVEATLVLREPGEPRAVLRAVREHCRGKLAPYQIPARVLLAAPTAPPERFKKMRQSCPGGGS
jgi:long-chain acyl-CoA synthetase